MTWNAGLYGNEALDSYYACGQVPAKKSRKLAMSRKLISVSDDYAKAATTGRRARTTPSRCTTLLKQVVAGKCGLTLLAARTAKRGRRSCGRGRRRWCRRSRHGKSTWVGPRCTLTALSRTTEATISSMSKKC